MGKQPKKLFISSMIQLILLVLLVSINFFTDNKDLQVIPSVILAVLIGMNTIYMIRSVIKLRGTKE